MPFERLRFGYAVAFRLFLGVSLSAAARSAAALVYDKLTPNCHPVLEGYMKIGIYKRLPLRLYEVQRHIRIRRTENSTFA